MSRILLSSVIPAVLGAAAFSFPGWKVLVCFVLCLLFFYITQPVKYLAVYFLIFVLFLGAAWTAEKHAVSAHKGDETSFRISFTKKPVIDGNLFKAEVESRGEPMVLRFVIPSPEIQEQLSYVQSGFICQASGTLETADQARNPNGFDYKLYLKHKGIAWILQADQLEPASCRMPPINFLSMLEHFRSKAIDYVNEVFPGESRGYVNALLFGDQTNIDEADLTAYQRLGLVHLLAISGLHVSFLAGLVFYAGIRLGITRERMMLLLLLLLPVYILLTGASPSVLRSCFTSMIFFGSMLLRRNLPSAGTLAFVFLVLLLFRPDYLFHTGFQLSFAVSFAIVMSASVLKRYAGTLKQLFLISFICQLAALPILLYTFFEVSFLGILLNVVFVPLYSFLLPFSIGALLLRLLSASLADPLIQLLNECLVLAGRIAGFISELPLSSLVFGKPGFWIMLLLIITVLAMMVCWDAGSGSFWRFTAAAAVLLFIQYHQALWTDEGQVVFIDVGQGDSILIKLPHNKGNYLIDTGGSLQLEEEAWKVRKDPYNTAEDTILPLLKSLGIHKLDKLILTHPDADHVGSAGELVDGIKVEELVIGAWSGEDYRNLAAAKAAKKNKVPVTKVKRGDRWRAENASFLVAEPSKAEDETNDASIVLYAELGGLRWLFTGDFGVHGEGELAKNYPGLHADVLKVGHHGSKTATSPEFLSAVKPKAAVISAGEHNRYGHPHQQVLATLEDSGVRVFRTDQQGAIIYLYSKRGGTFSHQLP